MKLTDSVPDRELKLDVVPLVYVAKLKVVRF